LYGLGNNNPEIFIVLFKGYPGRRAETIRMAILGCRNYSVSNMNKLIFGLLLHSV
jgi:hypothetical protein